MSNNKRLLCTFLLGFILFNAFCIDVEENVDSFRAKINGTDKKMASFIVQIITEGLL